MGVAVGVLGVQAHHAQKLLDALGALGLAGAQLVDVQGLADDLAHRHAGVQGGGGVLEDDLHLPPVGEHVRRLLPGHRLLHQQGALVLGAVGVLHGDGLALEGVLVLVDGLTVVEDGAGGGLMEPQDGAAQGGLAAAGLAHQAQGLAPLDEEGHVLHGLDAGALHALDGEVFGQVVHLDQDVLVLSHCRPPPCSRPCRPSPSGAAPAPAASRRSGGPPPAPHRGASSAGRSSWRTRTGGRRGSPRGD